MIEHPEIDASLLSSPHERIGALEKRGTVAARARENERRQIGAIGVERRHAGPHSDALIRRPRQTRA